MSFPIFISRILSVLTIKNGRCAEDVATLGLTVKSSPCLDKLMTLTGHMLANSAGN